MQQAIFVNPARVIVSDFNSDVEDRIVPVRKAETNTSPNWTVLSGFVASCAYAWKAKNMDATMKQCRVKEIMTFIKFFDKGREKLLAGQYHLYGIFLYTLRSAINYVIK
ncbi:MAG: hypothetical protein LBD45_07320 [Bacteroidales bacterium]|nr:hypothetical protein [Bacteroidales bacterium]